MPLLFSAFGNLSAFVSVPLAGCNILMIPYTHRCSILSCSSSSPYHNPCFSPPSSPPLLPPTSVCRIRLRYCTHSVCRICGIRDQRATGRRLLCNVYPYFCLPKCCRMLPLLLLLHQLSYIYLFIYIYYFYYFIREITATSATNPKKAFIYHVFRVVACVLSLVFFRQHGNKNQSNGS